MRVLDTEAMRQVDQTAIDEIGIPSLVLMENAAIGVADAIATSFPEVAAVAIFCGPGNNGGDGLALARHLTIRGYHVELALITSGKGLSGDAEIQLEICRRQGLSVPELVEGDPIPEVIASARGLDLAVDSLFGTGLTRPLSGHYAAAIAAFNLLPIPRLAVDLPSGLNGSSSAIIGPHVEADLTVTFGAPKVPHVLLPAAEASGEVVVADLGIPDQLVEQAAGQLHLLTSEELGDTLKRRAPESHKGDYGHTLILAGSLGKAGAAILSASGAVRAGAGLVTVATPRSIVQTVDLGSLESMTLPLQEDASGGLREENLDAILESAVGKQVLAIGPGLGTEPSTVDLIRRLVGSCSVPIVLDADGVNAFAGMADQMAEASGARVLTPHPGELARLLEVSSSEVQSDRLGHARIAAAKTQSIVVLKGAQSLVASPHGDVYVNPTGNPGMATGGTGDVLTGLIAGLISQGYDLLAAACLGVYLHGAAGDLAADDVGQASLRAGDILHWLPGAFRQIQS